MIVRRDKIRRGRWVEKGDRWCIERRKERKKLITMSA